MKQLINTPAAPMPIGPYNQAVALNGMLFVSGQIAIDPATGDLVPGGVTEQTQQVFKNLISVLTAAGTDLKHVVRSGVFLKNMNDFAAMNAVYATFFPENPPARSTVEVARLPKDCLVEIEMIALVP